MVIASKPKKTDNQATNITLRGVTPEAFKVRTGINLVEGRMFSPGVFEVIAGKKISDRVKGLDIGDTVRVQRKEFKVVGLFTADGSSFESEMWGDYNALGPAVGRNGGCESLTVRLSNPAMLSGLDKDLRAQSTDPGASRLGAHVLREPGGRRGYSAEDPGGALSAW